MNSQGTPSDALIQLVDDYLAGTLDEAGTTELDRLLRQSASARAYFVHYCRVETDLRSIVRATRAGAAAMQRIAREAAPTENKVSILPRGAIRWRWLLAACIMLVTAGVGFLVVRGRSGPVEPAVEIAWLVNAQDCDWDSGAAGGLSAGKVLKLQRGLAELRMTGGATVILEGPVHVELVSRDSLRMLAGKVAVRAERSARGFQVLLPQGHVLDLGTEFGISVTPDGAARVVVFEGKVDAFPKNGSAKLTLTQSQSAQVNQGGVTLEPATLSTTQPFNIARQIRRIPHRVPRQKSLDFTTATTGTLADRDGSGTGLTHRLPGTGGQIPASDPNLSLDIASASLRLTTTRSDINHRFRLPDGEYLGLRLADLGFSGKEDFEISVVLPNIPSLAAVGQFGLYAGARSDCCIRGGLISQRTPDHYSQFLVNNDSGKDQNAIFVGLVETGNDVRVALRRTDGNYTLTVENLTNDASSTLSIRPLASLAEEKQMYVGFFGANTGSEERQTLAIKSLSATVWTKQ